MREVWKDIPNYEGLYQVSDLGRVKSLPKKWIGGKGAKRSHNGKILKSGRNEKGYLSVVFYRYNTKITRKVHRLVLLAFIGESNLQCNHKNGIKDDNKLENLEYCTRSENMKHAFRLGLSKGRKGIDHHMCKLTEKEVFEIRDLYSSGLFSQRKLAGIYGIVQVQICDIIRKRTWKHI